MMEKCSLRLYALCGSQRAGSINRMLLEALQKYAPNTIAIEICDLLGELPIFNPDLEGERTPDSVKRFAAKIRQADGLLIACPEYAHEIPGGLKNALDWLVSRDEVPHKPVMIAHASHRGDHMLEQLAEVLKTMSLRIVSDVFLRVPLSGKALDMQAHEVSGAQEKIKTHLQLFADAIEAQKPIKAC